jgi:putative cell wall-binding protein
LWLAVMRGSSCVRFRGSDRVETARAVARVM